MLWDGWRAIQEVDRGLLFSLALEDAERSRGMMVGAGVQIQDLQNLPGWGDPCVPEQGSFLWRPARSSAFVGDNRK